MVNTPGTIDSGYRGEIKICLINHDLREPIELRRGDRIAQLVVQRVEHAVFREVDELADSPTRSRRIRVDRWACGTEPGREGGGVASGAVRATPPAGSRRRGHARASTTSTDADRVRRGGGDLFDDAGPYDEADAPEDGVPRIDLGSVQLPVPEGAQLQVEMDPSGPVRAVHVVTPLGQVTVNAYAAPRSGGLWREVCDELAEQLRADGATVRTHTGEWGLELLAALGEVALRFVGVDGPRWMLRGVVAGPPDAGAAAPPRCYELVRGTVVVRGSQPMPVRNPLPIELPPAIAQHIAGPGGRGRRRRHASTAARLSDYGSSPTTASRSSASVGRPAAASRCRWAHRCPSSCRRRSRRPWWPRSAALAAHQRQAVGMLAVIDVHRDDPRQAPVIRLRLLSRCG